MKNCLISERIKQIKKGENIHFVCELESSYVVLGDSQFYKGYTLLLSKNHCTELHHLGKETRTKYLEEMALVSEVLFKLFNPVKLNYELLGNRHAHLHWHLIPRHSDYPDINNPIWIISKETRNNTFLNPEELLAMKEKLKIEIRTQ